MQNLSASFSYEQVMGIEPTSQPWEGRVLPMNYTCERVYFTAFAFLRQDIIDESDPQAPYTPFPDP